ncbi:MAG: hypothetical protein HYV26_05935 [Candidatus Hydrogenedentes bacterium]|nr:hypothetical protein [Candidatus Hydrogenedentota bacterium]
MTLRKDRHAGETFVPRQGYVPGLRLRVKSLLTVLCACSGIVLLGAASLDGCRLGNNLPPIANDTCLACHNGQIAPDAQEILDGAHRAIRCETCHGNGYLHVRNPQVEQLIINPSNLPFAQAIDVCSTCHGDKAEGHLDSAHGLEQLTCLECHNVHRANGMVLGDESPEDFSKESYAQLCGDCHETQVDGYLLSTHGQFDLASCGDCHDVHLVGGLTASPVDNSLCQQCHANQEFRTEEDIDFHTGFFHPVDPAGSGASRCVGCHLPPLEQSLNNTAPHDHTLRTIPPIFSNEQMDLGVSPAPPNSCSGVAGCHDPSVLGSGAPHDPDSRAQNEALQPLYESIGDRP